MFSMLQNRGSPAGTAARFDQIGWIKQFPAMLTLITPGIFVAAVRTGAPYKAIGQKAPAAVTIQLLDSRLADIPVGIHLPKNILYNFSLFRTRCAAEMIKINMKPLINIVVHHKIAVAQLFWAYALFKGLGLCSGTILIATTNVKGFIPVAAAIPRKDICRQHLDKVTQMRNIIYIRKGRSYQSSLFHN